MNEKGGALQLRVELPLLILVVVVVAFDAVVQQKQTTFVHHTVQCRVCVHARVHSLHEIVDDTTLLGDVARA